MIDNDVIININDERDAAVGEAFLNGYIYIKEIFKDTCSSGSEKTRVFMRMGKSPEKCKWKLTKYPETYKIPFKVNTSCNNKFKMGKILDIFKFCPYCGKEIEEIENE